MLPRSDDRAFPDDQGVTVQAAWNGLLSVLGSPSTDMAVPSTATSAGSIDPIPVTVLTGFLGAGKTTLLCQLLAQTSLAVIAIVNDLARVNIDAALVRARNAETIQLENGCACCVLGDDLDRALSEIGCRPARPDAIIIETSGISDPMGVAQAVARNPATVLDGIVTLADASRTEAILQDPVAAPLLQRQLDAAHLVLLTHTSASADLAQLRQTIGARAPGRPLLALDIDAPGIESLVLGAGLRGARPEPGRERHAYEGFSNRIIDLPLPVAGSALEALLNRIPASVYRIKGWISLLEGAVAGRYLVQGVGPRWRITPAAEGTVPNELVVIGDGASRSFGWFCSELEKLVAEGAKGGDCLPA